jgi:hypothetical protein
LIILEIEASKHTSIITQNIHKFYISLGTVDERVIEHVMPPERGRRDSQGEKVQESQDLSTSASAEPQGSYPCVGLL